MKPMWSNLFGGPAGGPVPHLLFVAILYLCFVNQTNMTLEFALASYLASFVITLPFLAIKFYSLSRDFEATEVESGPAMTASALLTLALPIMLTQSSGIFLSQADVWLAGAWVVPGTVAIYCSAQRMLGLLTIPLQIAGTAIVPFVPELVSKGKTSELQETVRLASFVSGIPALVVSGLLLFFHVRFWKLRLEVTTPRELPF